MWLMKNSVKIVKLFLFMPPRKVHCFTETMGKEEGEKEKDRTAKYSCRRSKGSPAPVYLLWCWGGAITLHMCNINFNPCTPEGATMQIAYFLHSIYFNPCTPEGAPV